MNALEALASVQAKLKAPKNQTNKFGGYNYRSCEDILEAVKPLLAEVGAVVTISDEVAMIGDRYYIKATATFKAEHDLYSVSAFAREQNERKGMDASQVTGSASSYARKYALNGLFLIDDTKDADAQEPEKPKGKPKQKAEEPKAIPDKVRAVADLWQECKDAGLDGMGKWYKDAGYGGKSLDALSETDLANVRAYLEERLSNG